MNPDTGKILFDGRHF